MRPWLVNEYNILRDKEVFLLAFWWEFVSCLSIGDEGGDTSMLNLYHQYQIISCTEEFHQKILSYFCNVQWPIE